MKFTVRVKGLHVNTKIKEVKAFFSPLRVGNVQFFKNGVCLVSFGHEDAYKKALLKRGQIHRHDVRVDAWEARSSQNANDSNVPEVASKPHWPVKSLQEIEAAIQESGRLFVRNLPFECNEQDFEQLFSTYGTLSDIHLSYDVIQQVPKGFGFVTFLFPSDAVTAFRKLDKTKFMGRLLHILPAEDPPEKPASFQKGDFSSSMNDDQTVMSRFQEARHKELKDAAGTAHNWNALFVRPDAVATYLAAKFGLTKEQVLDPSGKGSVAVRLALAETQLVTEMREFLQKHHVDLDAFDQPVAGTEGRRDRSDAKSSLTVRQLSGTAFLIKNLPVGTTEDEVRELLNQHTGLARRESSQSGIKRFHPKRIIVPPLGITAIVEFALSQQARLIYRSLAYEPFKDNILYLQWLPHGALKSDVDADPNSADSPSGNHKDEVPGTSADEATVQNQTDTEFALNTSPSDITVRSRKRHRHPKAETTPVANEAMLPDTSTKRRKYMNKKERIKKQEQVDGLTITGSVEEPVVPEGELVTGAETQIRKKTHKSTTNTKPVLVVRNVSFQATRKELTELFKPFGGLVRIRLPQKPAGGHRGFAFVEFATVDQAKVALKSLGSDTHLLGRRLRPEFAED